MKHKNSVVSQVTATAISIMLAGLGVAFVLFGVVSIERAFDNKDWFVAAISLLAAPACIIASSLFFLLATPKSFRK